MKRRQDDPEDADFMDKRSGIPAWVRAVSMVGVPAIIALGLLGMLPGVRSPFDRIEDAVRASAETLRSHDQTTREALRVHRLVCAGVWKDQPAVARTCYGSNGHDAR